MVLLRENADATAGTADPKGASTDRVASSPVSSGPHESFSVDAFEFILPIGFESDRVEATRLPDRLCLARSIWPSHLVGSRKRFAKPNDSAAAVRKLMTRPHSRNKTGISWSLHSSDLSLNVLVRSQTWSVAEPALEQLRNNDHWHLGIDRESLEFDVKGVGVFSTVVATSPIETVGCIFEINKAEKPAR